MKKLLLGVSAVLFIFSSNAFAAENTPYIEGRIGQTYPMDTDWSGTNGAASVTGDIAFDPNLAFGGEIGVRNVSGTGLRLGLSILSTKIEADEVCIDGLGCATVSGAEAELDANVYMGNAYYDFSIDTNFKPYFGVGIGFVDADDGSDFAASASVGINYQVNDNFYIGLRGDFIYTDTADSSTEGAVTVNVDGINVWSSAIVVGFSF
jgi:opacity protein-like surface antigen